MDSLQMEQLLPVPSSGSRISRECNFDWFNNEKVEDIPEYRPLESAHRSWILVLGVSLLLLTVSIITLFIVAGSLFPSIPDDPGHLSRTALGHLYDFPPIGRSHSYSDGADLNQLNDEITALAKRTEALSQLLVQHGDALLHLQTTSSAAQCISENDWAPASTINEMHTSPSVGRKPGQWFSWFQPALWAPHGPEVTLALGPVQRGHCFAFSVPGQIQVVLPHMVTLSGWGITALMSESQPQRIRAIALPSGDDLGTLNFDRKNSTRIQKVILSNRVDAQTVRFLVDNSFGASFCCLYRLHVYG